MKIKVLEVNNIDLLGRRFNGYDLKNYLNSTEEFEIKQAVIHKLSNDDEVIPITTVSGINMMERLKQEEDSLLSVHSVLSITSVLLQQLEEYQEADIVHFHMFHNSNFSLSSLKKICLDKKVVISLHDPWFMTGRCVHPYDCQKWKTGCKNCPSLGTLFPMKKDNAQYLWNLKKNVFSQISCDLIFSSKFMGEMVQASPILNKQKSHFIPLGINLNEFKPSNNYNNLRKKYNIDKDSIVYFFRAQKEFKGTEYILEALKMLEADKKMVFITCDVTGMLDEVKNKFTIIDFGIIKDNQKLLELYQLCDIFLMPSLGESFGYMAIEAMACAKPVVIFDNSALPSVTFAPECGVLVKNRDALDLAKKIVDLKNSKEERTKRGALGRKLVEANYDIDNYHEKVADLYRNLIHDKVSQKKVANKKTLVETKEVDILKRRLEIITKHLQIPARFMLLKNNSKYFWNKNSIIDYGIKPIQDLVDNYNNLLVDYIDVGDTRHPFKTAIHLLIYDRKKLVETLKNKLKGGK